MLADCLNSGRQQGDLEEGRSAHLGRKLENVRFDAPQNVRPDHLMQFFDFGFVKLILVEPLFERFEITAESV